MSTISVKLEGIDALTAKLVALGANGEEALQELITDVVVQTHSLAVTGIQRGPKTGRVYLRGSVSHRASAPGQYPASDTGRLASGVKMELPTGESMVGVVGTNVAYGPMLEFGTSKMAARPWLLRSFEQAKIDVETDIKAKLEARL